MQSVCNILGNRHNSNYISTQNSVAGLYQEDQILAKVGVIHISISQYNKIKQFIIKKMLLHILPVFQVL